MCGISGIINLEKQEIDIQSLKKMTDVITHRGPDDAGYALIDTRTSRIQSFSDTDSHESIRSSLPLLGGEDSNCPADIGLGHRRFSIIDLSAGGHQPFIDKTSDFCLAYNGEIFNYVELRERLESEGVQFATESDTEVLLESYKAWGPDCFKEFNGYWAVLLYDRTRGELIASRDHLGKKPLYWARHGSLVYFASEIRSLLEIPAINRGKKVNEKAVWRWCALGQRDVDGETMWEGIRSFPEGSWTVVNNDYPHAIKPFWEMPRSRLSESDISIKEATESVRERLQNAVRIRLRADVPLATPLSGGVDSSIIVSIAAQLQSDPITTFTVMYDDPRWNEEPYARSLARRYNTDYRVIKPSFETFWSHILAFTKIEEEPYHSPNLMSSQIMWSLMRNEGVKVGLSGAGGDELFAGYRKFFAKAQNDLLAQGQYWRFATNVVGNTERRARNHLRAIVGQLSRPLRIKLGLKEFSGATPAVTPPWFNSTLQSEQFVASDSLHQSIYDDMTSTLQPYWLRSGDKGYMSVPFESRQPFLDYQVVELAMSLPQSYLVRNGWSKWVLRKAFEGELPNDVVWRKRKMGFPFPFDDFYRQNSAIIDLIIKSSSNPYLDTSMSDDYRSNWRILSFILWYELFCNENVELFDKIEQMSHTDANEFGFTPLYLCGQQENTGDLAG